MSSETHSSEASSESSSDTNDIEETESVTTQTSRESTHPEPAAHGDGPRYHMASARVCGHKDRVCFAGDLSSSQHSDSIIRELNKIRSGKAKERKSCVTTRLLASEINMMSDAALSRVQLGLKDKMPSKGVLARIKPVKFRKLPALRFNEFSVPSMEFKVLPHRRSYGVVHALSECRSLSYFDNQDPGIDPPEVERIEDYLEEYSAALLSRKKGKNKADREILAEVLMQSEQFSKTRNTLDSDFLDIGIDGGRLFANDDKLSNLPTHYEVITEKQEGNQVRRSVVSVRNPLLDDAGSRETRRSNHTQTVRTIVRRPSSKPDPKSETRRESTITQCKRHNHTRGSKVTHVPHVAVSDYSERRNSGGGHRMSHNYRGSSSMEKGIAGVLKHVEARSRRRSREVN